MKKLQQLLLAVTMGLTFGACALVNTAVPQYGTPLEKLINTDQPFKAEDAKPVTFLDWFFSADSLHKYDVDKNHIIDAVESYRHAKHLRNGYLNSKFMVESDTDKNGFVDEKEWQKGIATVRVNGKWTEVFDQDKDKKLSVNEELFAVAQMSAIYNHYSQVCTTCALSFTQYINVDLMSTFDKNKDSNIDGNEANAYFNEKLYVEYFFYYDWNDDGKVDGAEHRTAKQALTEVLKEVNAYLTAKKMENTI